MSYNPDEARRVALRELVDGLEGGLSHAGGVDQFTRTENGFSVEMTDRLHPSPCATVRFRVTVEAA